MKILSHKVYLIFFIIGTLFVGSCQKDNVNLFKTEYQNIAKQNALVQAAFDDALKVAENIMMNNSDAKIGTQGAGLGCITSVDTVVTGVNMKEYTIVFSSSCTSYDGKYRTGQMNILLNGTNYNNVGTEITITFDNYYINESRLKGKMIVTNIDGSSFKVVVSDEAGSGYAELIFGSTGQSTFWRSTHKKIIYSGDGDNNMLNNKYRIVRFSGPLKTFDGISTDGINYYGNPDSEGLLLDYGCTASGSLRYPIDGSIEFAMGADTRKLDYGAGTCDYAVQLMSGSSYLEFSLY